MPLAEPRTQLDKIKDHADGMGWVVRHVPSDGRPCMTCKRRKGEVLVGLGLWCLGVGASCYLLGLDDRPRATTKRKVPDNKSKARRGRAAGKSVRKHHRKRGGR